MEQSHVHKTDKTGNKRIWLFVALGVLLLLSVFRALGFVTEALALEQQPRCGMTEHLHTESCYINDVLVCRQKAHTHSDSCYPLLLADQRHQPAADADRLHPRQKPGKPAALRQRARHSGAEQGSPGADHAGGQRRSGFPVDRRRGTAGRQRHAQHRLQRHQLLHPAGREYHLHRQQDPDHQPKYPPALKNQRGQRLYRCGGDITDHR